MPVHTTVVTAKEKQKVLVAVYGSLRQGMGNDHLNKRAKALYLGEGKTVYNYNIYPHYGPGFPHVSLKHDCSDSPVTVELYETNQYQLESAYDCLEGYPDFYNRTPVAIRMENDDIVEAWIYHIDQHLPDQIKSGDWCEYKAAIGD